MKTLGSELREKNHFGTLLKRYRQAARLSQEALAERAGLSARAISDLERGINRAPRYTTLEALMNALSLAAPQRDLLQAAAQPELTNEPPPRSANIFNFPSPPNRTIGRERELTGALALLQGGTRLLTLTGPSGVGKTQLALELGRSLISVFDAGVAFVSLAPIRDASLVPVTVAQKLRLAHSSSSSPAEQVQEYLRNKRFLLVLDNVEQVLDSASFIANLLLNCPRLSILATSRTPLDLQAEYVFELTPLPIEDAVKLFSERAAAVRQDQTYSASEVAAICEQLDRLPLAIELAARHVKILALPELQKRLVHRLELLRGGPRDLPARQQTMADAIAWSYELLGESQQKCFRALGVFVGGWTLEAAEQVWGKDEKSFAEDVVSTLATLVDASLVQTEVVASGMVRFTMLELIREFALERLRVAGKDDLYRRRHATYFARLAENASTFFGPRPTITDTSLALEFPNIRAALEWAEENREADLGLRLIGINRLWLVLGQASEAASWLERMLAVDLQARSQGAQPAPPPLRIERLNNLGRVLLGHGKIERGIIFANEALQLANRIGDEHSIGNSWATLGYLAQANGNLEEADHDFTQASLHADKAEDMGLQNQALIDLAEVARMQGNLDHANILFEQALAQAKAHNAQWSIAIVSTLLGHLARQQQDYALAQAHYRQALTVWRTIGSPTFSAWCLEGYAATISVEGDVVPAARLLAAAAGLRESVGTPLPPLEQQARDKLIIALKKALGEERFAQEWTNGSRLMQDEAITEALDD